MVTQKTCPFDDVNEIWNKGKTIDVQVFNWVNNKWEYERMFKLWNEGLEGVHFYFVFTSENN